MSGFFKKLFNRVIGKEEAPAAAPEPAPTPAVPEPQPVPVTYLQPAPEPDPAQAEEEVFDYEVPGPEDDLVVDYDIPGPEDDDLVEDEIIAEEPEPEPIAENVVPESEPEPDEEVAVSETEREPGPELEPEPAFLPPPVAEPDTKKASTLEKLKNLWPLGKKKSAKSVEETPQPLPPPPPPAPPEPEPTPEPVVEATKPAPKSKKDKAEKSPPPLSPAKKGKKAKFEELVVAPTPIVVEEELPAPAPVVEVISELVVAPAPEPVVLKPTRAKAQPAAEPISEPPPSPLSIDVPPQPAARPASGLKKAGQKAALKKVDAPPPLPPPPPEPEKKGWLSRLKDGLSKSSKSITTQITTIFKNKKLDKETLQDLEDTLIQADLGITVSERIIKEVSTGRYDKEIDPEEVKKILAEEVAKVLRPVEVPFNFGTEKPYVILVVGVNGSGKTTTIGKLGSIAMMEGFKVKFAACDTFRAAAIEQLTVWGKRIGAETIWRPQGADAAGLAFDAMKACQADGTDILFIDTAGRLHNKTYLMDELDKVVRVIKKYDAAAPHAVLLVLDATTGQNALAQAEAFTKVAGVTGLIMTKLDGTARGGILVAIAEKYKLPIHAIGVGETLDDLQPFDAEAFSRAIAGLEEKEAA